MEQFVKIRTALFSFQELPDDSWRQLCDIFMAKNFLKGSTLTRGGETEQFIYFIEEGATRNYFIKDGKEFTVDFHFQDDFVTAYYSLITKKPSPVTIELLEDSKLIAIPYNKLEENYMKSIEGAAIGRKMAEYQYIRRLQKEMELLSLTAEERYSQLMEKNPKLVSSISVKHLSSYLGIQPESLSRIRKQFGRS
jgi:CRP-like cAMP-binding protein